MKLIDAIMAFLAKLPFTHWNEPEIDMPEPVQPMPEPVDTQETAPTPNLAPKRVYDVTKAHIGLEMTLNGNIDPSVRCAQAVSAVLKLSGYPVPATGINTVNELIQFMLDHGFEETLKPIPGCVITAHKVNRNDPADAHTGIVVNFGVVSNDSRTDPKYFGKFLQNYSSITNWDLYYTKLGCQTRYFIPV